MHINVLYGLIVVLLILNIVSFVSMSSQTARIVSDQGKIRSDLDSAIEDVRQENRGNIEEIVEVIARQNEAISVQRSDFESEIEELRLIQDDDFSEIIDSAIMSTVSIRTDRSTGTGFFITSDGYLVTNLHVVNGAEFIRIETFDDTVFDAQLVGVNALTDIALLYVPGVFRSFELAYSSEVGVGSAVIAVGNPLGLSFTVTEGIISAKNRRGPNGLENYLQTDVTLNPGNSGGPLVNKEGKVVGINNFKVGGAEGLGFALESDTVREVINSIIGEQILT